MKRRRVVFSAEARADLVALFDFVAGAAGEATASRYLSRVEAFCLGLGLASERGRSRDDIRPGLRVVGFERRMTIAFAVSDDVVAILRVFAAGRDWERELPP